jgi:aspartyl-tRNA(Asn)/glutamyl-tRNA(Gln) amidotransferase subunit B
LEIDSGKSIRHRNLDLIDLNRAGVALIEIVTAPEFYNPTEVVCFVEQLKIALSHNGICFGHFHGFLILKIFSKLVKRDMFRVI